jgi:hypothetical protein
MEEMGLGRVLSFGIVKIEYVSSKNAGTNENLISLS